MWVGHIILPVGHDMGGTLYAFCQYHRVYRDLQVCLDFPKELILSLTTNRI